MRVHNITGLHPIGQQDLVIERSCFSYSRALHSIMHILYCQLRHMNARADNSYSSSLNVRELVSQKNLLR